MPTTKWGRGENRPGNWRERELERDNTPQGHNRCFVDPRNPVDNPPTFLRGEGEYNPRDPWVNSPAFSWEEGSQSEGPPAAQSRKRQAGRVVAAPSASRPTRATARHLEQETTAAIATSTAKRVEQSTGQQVPSSMKPNNPATAPPTPNQQPTTPIRQQKGKGKGKGKATIPNSDDGGDSDHTEAQVGAARDRQNDSGADVKMTMRSRGDGAPESWQVQQSVAGPPIARPRKRLPSRRPPLNRRRVEDGDPSTPVTPNAVDIPRAPLTPGLQPPPDPPTPTRPNPQPRARGNNNSITTPGRFLDRIMYTASGANLMRGVAWSEVGDLRLLQLRKQGIAYHHIAEGEMIPGRTTVGPLQNRIQKLRAVQGMESINGIDIAEALRALQPAGQGSATNASGAGGSRGADTQAQVNIGENNEEGNDEQEGKEEDNEGEGEEDEEEPGDDKNDDDDGI